MEAKTRMRMQSLSSLLTARCVLVSRVFGRSSCPMYKQQYIYCPTTIVDLVQSNKLCRFQLNFRISGWRWQVVVSSTWGSVPWHFNCRWWWSTPSLTHRENIQFSNWSEANSHRGSDIDGREIASEESSRRSSSRRTSLAKCLLTGERRTRLSFIN